MPIYEYQCEKCGSELEMMQKITESPLVMHADCGGNLKRLISNTAFHLKGTGWYATDYASGAKNGEAAAAEKSSSAPAGSSATPAPSAPAAPAGAEKII